MNLEELITYLKSREEDPRSNSHRIQLALNVAQSGIFTPQGFLWGSYKNPKGQISGRRKEYEINDLEAMVWEIVDRVQEWERLKRNEENRKEGKDIHEDFMENPGGYFAGSPTGAEKIISDIFLPKFPFCIILV